MEEVIQVDMEGNLEKGEGELRCPVSGSFLWEVVDFCGGGCAGVGPPLGEGGRV